MIFHVCVIGAGLAGSEAALQLAMRGAKVTLVESRPASMSPVHETDLCAELVCSNSFKGEKPSTAPGMLKHELASLGSRLYLHALDVRVLAGSALAVDRSGFARAVTSDVLSSGIQLVRAEAAALDRKGYMLTGDGESIGPFDAVIIATGPLTGDRLAGWLSELTGSDALSFYDAAAPIVYADSLDMSRLFSQNRYNSGNGDYLNAALDREEYERFVSELVRAERVLAKDFEGKELFGACQPIEEIARAGMDAPRHGPLKPVGLTDPSTGRRPWAAVQLRAEDAFAQSYNLVGFQTNLSFREQERVFRMIPGLERAEFSRFGVMHRNTFLDAPRVMDMHQRLLPACDSMDVPVYLAGQVSGTEGYGEAIRSGLHAAIELFAELSGIPCPSVPPESTYGSLLSYASDANTSNYQPMHVNFGLMPPLDPPVRNKGQRYEAYAQRGRKAIEAYVIALEECGLMP